MGEASFRFQPLAEIPAAAGNPVCGRRSCRSGIRTESLLGPCDGLGMAAHQILVAQAMGADDLVASHPVSMLLADDPMQRRALRDLPAQQCIASRVTQRQHPHHVFHEKPQHGRKQADHSNQILFAGSQSANAGRQFAEARASSKAMRRISAGWLVLKSLAMASMAMRRKTVSPTSISADWIEVISWRMAQRGEFTSRSNR